MTQAKPKSRPSVRLYVPDAYAEGVTLVLNQPQSHYLAHVMRMKEGDTLALFNGSDGEWLARVSMVAKKSVQLQLERCLAPQKSSPDVWLVFAPIKNKVDLVVEKAVELGVSKLVCVYTQHAVVKSINREKLALHAQEAAEQCGRVDVPSFEEYKDVSMLLGSWPADRTLLVADESGNGETLKALLPRLKSGKYAVMIGPEGGFSADERHLMTLCPSVQGFGLGPRILRADTASVAALACVQAWLGDWEEQPDFKDVST